MCVDNDPDVDAKRIPKNHVGSLAAHAWQFGQGFYRRWHLTAVVRDDLLARCLDVLRLVLVEPDPADCLGKPLRVCKRIVAGSLELLEEILRYLVDLLVGTLGRQDRGHEKFQWIGKEELAMGIGIGRPEESGDGFTASEAVGFGFPWHTFRYRCLGARSTMRNVWDSG